MYSGIFEFFEIAKDQFNNYCRKILRHLQLEQEDLLNKRPTLFNHKNYIFLHSARVTREKILEHGFSLLPHLP